MESDLKDGVGRVDRGSRDGEVGCLVRRVTQDGERCSMPRSTNAMRTECEEVADGRVGRRSSRTLASGVANRDYIEKFMWRKGLCYSDAGRQAWGVCRPVVRRLPERLLRSEMLLRISSAFSSSSRMDSRVAASWVSPRMLAQVQGGLFRRRRSRDARLAGLRR